MTDQPRRRAAGGTPAPTPAAPALRSAAQDLHRFGVAMGTLVFSLLVTCLTLLIVL